MDIVYLHGLKCECTIGVWEWEKAITQTLVLDIDIATDVTKAANNDDLKKALDYQAIAEHVKAYAKDNTFELIETLAERLSVSILSEFDTPWVRIKLDKSTAVKGVKNVGVVIERGSDEISD